MVSTTESQTVTVNGESMRLPARCSIHELIGQLTVSGRYAVEINGEIVPRSAHVTHLVAEGDVIEIVAAIGGG
jgi:sulfur carrier protein